MSSRDETTQEARDAAAASAASVWDEAPCALLLVDRDLQVREVNAAARSVFERGRSELVGTPLPLLLAPQSRQALANAAAAACDLDGEAQAFELLLPRENGDLAGFDGLLGWRKDGFHLSLVSAEKRLARQRTLENKLKGAELAASIVAASSDAIFSLSKEGRILSWNHGAENLYGYAEAEALGQTIEMLVPRERGNESVRRVHAVLSGENVYFETERRHKDGSMVPVAISGGPIVDSAGEVLGIAAVHRDIRLQIKHETQLRFVMRELAHRTKNLLAIIQSIERQTARTVTSTEEFHERFSLRLQALAASHDLLVETNWAGAPIGDLIRRQLAAFSDEIGGRIQLSGPAMRLSPSVAQTIGLALHELATNATKYGALSQTGGRVSVAWGVYSEETGAPRFRIQWRESGGPPVVPPSRRGFGLQAIERLAAQAINGEAELVFAPDGLLWTLSSDPANVEPSSEGGDSV